MKKAILFIFIVLFIINIQAQETEPRFTNYNTGITFKAITIDTTSQKVWAGTTQSGVFNLDISLETLPTSFSTFTGADPNGPALGSLRIQSMAADGLGNIWIGHQGINFTESQGGMEHIDSDLNVTHISADRNALGFSFLQRDGLGTRDVKSIAVDKDNTVWAAQKNHNLTSGATFILTPGTISHKKVGDALFKSRSTWWDPITGTGNAQTDELPYPAFTFNPGPTEGPQSRNMQAISADSTEVWVGSWGYVPRDDENDFVESRILRYDFDGNYIPGGTSPYGGFSFADIGFPAGGIINNIFRNNSQGTWVTTSFTGKGFAVYQVINDVGIWTYMNPETFAQVMPPGTRFNDNAIWSDTAGRVYLGTNNGIIVYDGKGAITDPYSYRLYTLLSYASNLSIRDPGMISMNITGGVSEPDTPGTSWVATINGIMKFVLLPDDLEIFHIINKEIPSTSELSGRNNYLPLAQLKREYPPFSSPSPDDLPKFAADSTSSSLFRYYTDNPEEFYNSIGQDSERFTLIVGPAAGPLDSDYQNENYKLRYGSFTLKDPFFYDEINDASEIDQLEYVDYIYTHPEYIDPEDYAGTDKNYAVLSFNIWDGDTTIIFNHNIHVTVPPVLLGHGVWSSTASLDAMDVYLQEKGFITKKAWRTSDKVAENSHSEDANIIPEYINKTRSKAVDSRVSAGKVNVIVHSRGGLYTKAYIEGLSSGPTYNNDVNSLITLNTPHFGSQAANLVMDRRVVKLTRITSALQYLQPPFNSLEALTAQVEDTPLGELISIVGFPPEADRVNNWGARNLLVETDFLSGISPEINPNFIQTLNNSVNRKKLEGIPLHAIATTFETCEANPAFCNEISGFIGEALGQDIPDEFKRRMPKSVFRLVWFFRVVEFGLNTVPSTIDGFTKYLYRGSIDEEEPNDLIVPLTSMKAGLEPQFVSTLPGENIAHIDISGTAADILAPNATGVTTSPAVHDRLFELLRQDVHSPSSNFTKDGINREQLPYLFLAGWNGDIASRNNAAIDSKIFINKDPAVFDTVSEGDILTYNIYTESIDKMLVDYDLAEKDSLIYDIRDVLTFENETTYQVPEGYYGKLTVRASGFKDKKLVAIDTISFNVGLPAGVTLTGIRFGQEDPVILNQDNYSFNVIGSFSDGIDRNINDFEGMVYTIEDTAILSQINNTTIKGNTVGSSILTASVNGFEDSILITVSQNPSLSQTILTGFYALPETSSSSIDIFWETLREFENQSFALETSYNTPDNFVEINQQAGNGTTLVPAEFSFMDTSFGANTLIYYRLKMTDTSANITYSSIIEVNLNSLSIDDLSFDSNIKLYPNPVTSDNVTLSMDSGSLDENAKLELYSLQGKKLSTQALRIIRGNNKYNITISNSLSNGIYLIRVTNSSYIKSLKLMINR